MRSRQGHIGITLAVIFLLAGLTGCGSNSSAGDSPLASPTSPATATLAPTATPEPTATATATTEAATPTLSGGPRVPGAPESSPAFDALPDADILPRAYVLTSDERFGKVHEASGLSYMRGFVAGRLQLYTAIRDLFAVQIECGEFRSAALAKDAVTTAVEASTSPVWAAAGFVAAEVDIAPLGDHAAVVSGTQELDGWPSRVAQVWFTTGTVTCTVIGNAHDSDPLPEVVAIARIMSDE
jgi:hypothetical protein